MAKPRRQRKKELMTKVGARGSAEQVLYLRKYLDERLSSLRNERLSWWAHWAECAEFTLPRRYKWLVVPNQGNRGSPKNQKIIDNTATSAARVLSSGMMSGLSSPSRPWMKLSTGSDKMDEQGDVRTWLQQVERKMYRIMTGSNFYNAIATMYVDLVIFGTAVVIVYEDFDNIIHCYNPCAGEYFLAVNDKMVVDTMYRTFTLTVSAIVQKFQLENCSPTVQSLYRTGGAGLQKEFVIAHAIEPNIEDVVKCPGALGRPWREIYWELGSGQNYRLSEAGFHECPFIAPRWDTVSNDAYGTSPTMDALGDNKQLQMQQKVKAKALQKQVDPPMVADIRLKNQPATMIPGGMTYVPDNSNVGFKPAYEVRLDIADTTADIREVQNRIKTTYFNDIFLMISQLDTVRTATEIDARKAEQLVQLGPVIERTESEAQTPIIKRIYGIAQRARLAGKPIIDPAPDALKHNDLQIKYISMLAMSQLAAQTSSIERWVGMVGNLAAADQTALDVMNTVEVLKTYGDYLNVPAQIINEDKVVTQKTQARGKAMQQQQQQQASLAAVQGAQTLSQTQTGAGQNALEQIMSGAGKPYQIPLQRAA